VSPHTEHSQRGGGAPLHLAAGGGAGERSAVLHRHVLHRQHVGELQRVPQLLLVGRRLAGPGAVTGGLGREGQHMKASIQPEGSPPGGQERECSRNT